jgi:DnaJ domain
MDNSAAFTAAIDLLRVPSRVRRLRTQPLPDGMNLLLRVAAGDCHAEWEAIALTGRPLADLRKAAVFFIEQILLSPDADSYRRLGAQPTATNAELRRNMVFLLRVLHPDTAPADRSVFARRVTTAWDQLKTAERRAAYDAKQPNTNDALVKKKRTRLGKHGHRTTSDRRVVAPDHDAREGLLRRTLQFILLGVRS